MPLGLVDEVGQYVVERNVPLYAGDTVILYTDGLTEAANAADGLYSLERLCAVAAEHWREPAEAIKAAVVADVKRHIGGQALWDDLTLIVLKQT